MVATRSKSKNKKRKVLDVRQMSHNAACTTLDINVDVCCKVCKIKREQEMVMTMEGREQNNSFLLKGMRNKCGQRWTENTYFLS